MSNYNIVKTAYNNYLKYFSQAAQDKFVARVFNFKKDGYVVDVGSSGDSSNSRFFDRFLDWKAICVDQIDGDYSDRKKTRFYKGDATALDYGDMFKANGFPNVIDYLSVDVDDATNAVLSAIPFSDYKFGIITIEHDSYACGERRRADQRKILTDLGYYKLCSDVWFTLVNEKKEYFEDWWIHPQVLDLEKFKFLECKEEHIDVIMSKFDAVV